MSGSIFDWTLVAPATSSVSSAAIDSVGATGIIGLDLACTTDIDEALSLVYDQDELLAQAIARRLITPRGSLCYDTDYGFDVRAYLNAAMTVRQISSLEAAIAAECEKDERVSVATVSIESIAASSAMTIHVELETVSGTTELTLLVSSVTVDILRGEAQ